MADANGSTGHLTAEEYDRITKAANAQKAVYDAAKAAADARLAEKNANAAIFPAWDKDAKATTSEKAGKIESELLALMSVKSAAMDIVGKAKVKARGYKQVVVIAESQLPSFANLTSYLVQCEFVTRSLEAALGVHVVKPEPGIPKLTVSPRMLDGISKAGVTAGVVADAITGNAQTISGLMTLGKSLGSLLASDYDLTGVSVDPDDASAVAVVAGSLLQEVSGQPVVVPMLYELPGQVDAAQRMLARVAAMEGLGTRAEVAAAALEQQGDKASDDEKLQLGRLRTATEMFKKWHAALFAHTDNGSTGIELLARAKALKVELDKKAMLLLVKAQHAGGSISTQTSFLMSVFGWWPFRHSGGAAVRYTMMDAATGALLASGVATGYRGRVRSPEMVWFMH